MEEKENVIVTLREELVEKDRQLRDAFTNVSELMSIARNVKSEIICRNESNCSCLHPVACTVRS